MREMICLGMIALVGATGCTGATGHADKAQLDFAVAGEDSLSRASHGVPRFALQQRSLHAGEARILDAQVNPVAPIHVDARGGAIAVTFGRRHGSGAIALLDPSTLDPTSWEHGAPEKSAAFVSMTPQGVALQGGRTLLCWREGSMEQGYWAVAQLEEDGVPVGKPIVISPPDADVLGVPRVASAGAHRVVAVFPAMIGDSYKLVTVPVDGI
jgi:hypothetical protein